MAKAFVEAGRLAELVDFEKEVLKRAQLDFESAYRYYRDTFHSFYSQAFPDATGPEIVEARRLLAMERATEQDSTGCDQGQGISHQDPLGGESS